MAIEVLDLWPPAAEAVRRLGGRAHSRDILRFTTEHQLRTAVAAGRLVRATRGIYTVPAIPEALALAARCRGVLSHESAAQRLGLGLVFPPRVVHVTAPRGAKPPSDPSVVVHRVNLAASDVRGGMTRPVRTVLDCAVTLPFREAPAVADSALRCYHDLAPVLRAAAEQRRGPGRQRCLTVVRAASALPENAFESALRGSLISAGLTSFVPQVRIQTRTGNVQVDLADVGRRIAIEADGFEWHGDRHALAADCRRYDELVRCGWTVLRFAWEHVMFDDDWVAELVGDVWGVRVAA